MRQNNQSRARQPLNDKKLLEQVANSPDAQALAGMLTRDMDQASLQKIAENAAKGDTAQLQSLIRSITSTPGGAELLQRLGNSFGQK